MGWFPAEGGGGSITEFEQYYANCPSRIDFGFEAKYIYITFKYNNSAYIRVVYNAKTDPTHQNYGLVGSAGESVNMPDSAAQPTIHAFDSTGIEIGYAGYCTGVYVYAHD